jgi:hypothetical protein
MAVSQAERTGAPAKHSNGGEFLLVGGVLTATVVAALLLANQKGTTTATCTPACTGGETCVNGTCVAAGSCAGCQDKNGNCLCPIPTGTLAQDPELSIWIVDAAPAGSGLPCVRRSIVSEANGTRCGYDWNRIVEISLERSQAMPLGADVPLTGACPPQVGGWPLVGSG